MPTVQLSPPVAQALAARRGIVALESSVTAQGLPSPQNLASARACADAVRRAGSVPAITAVVDGAVCAGLDDAALERLASLDPALWKVGSRDLPVAAVRRATGGTTVSATCDIAARAGIRVFATGGIGGVHRRVAEHLDISQDLWALSRFPVAVVCAGAKSVLDLPKTLEALEALAVLVVGIGTRELPSFYSTTSGLELEHSVADAREAAELTRERFAQGQGGLLFCLPPPVTTAIPQAEVEAWILDALAEAERAQVRGKAVTPFLLSNLAKRSGGRTLAANLALLEHNAAFAGELAAALAALG